ncbi:lysis system i-spanin subunit Rz [Crenobacter caeni]|uniref:Lysozyme n=1 Tax=Crenobacter caeni TaxID=2705474 RepID=A0A6B2KN84_9NEIS|nr:lysis system i-spanin subunit Rz [Crenobacter caeni]NDV11692.1 lysozyme [Crenobacter caeni]
MPLLINIVVAALIALAAYADGYRSGAARTRADWTDERAKLEQAHADALADALSKTQAREQALAEVDKKLMEERADAQTEINRLRADLRAGTRRLSVAFAAAGSVPGAAASPGSGDAAARAELHPAAADDLVGLAADADDVTRQLAACQAVIAADRSTE